MGVGGANSSAEHKFVCVCTCVRQHAVALESGHIVDTGALVQAGVGCTLVNVSLAVGT